MELDHGQTSAADHVDLVHAGDAPPQDYRHEFQDLRGRGRGQVDVGQDGVLGAAVVRGAFTSLEREEEEERTSQPGWSNTKYCL